MQYNYILTMFSSNIISYKLNLTYISINFVKYWLAWIIKIKQVCTLRKENNFFYIKITLLSFDPNEVLAYLFVKVSFYGVVLKNWLE